MEAVREGRGAILCPASNLSGPFSASAGRSRRGTESSGVQWRGALVCPRPRGGGPGGRGGRGGAAEVGFGAGPSGERGRLFRRVRKEARGRRPHTPSSELEIGAGGFHLEPPISPALAAPALSFTNIKGSPEANTPAGQKAVREAHARLSSAVSRRALLKAHWGARGPRTLHQGPGNAAEITRGADAAMPERRFTSSEGTP